MKKKYDGFICTYCGSKEIQTIETRPTAYGVRRRRICSGCGMRFTTAETRVQHIAELIDTVKEECRRKA